jgi:excisionase family DNA binding protein
MEIQNQEQLPIVTPKKRGRKPKPQKVFNPPNEVAEPLWLSVSETARISGIGSKTVRRAIEANLVKFKVVGNRYLINLTSLISYLFKTTKLRNKFLSHGIGQYVDKWKQ